MEVIFRTDMCSLLQTVKRRKEDKVLYLHLLARKRVRRGKVSYIYEREEDANTDIMMVETDKARRKTSMSLLSRKGTGFSADTGSGI